MLQFVYVHSRYFFLRLLLHFHTSYRLSAKLLLLIFEHCFLCYCIVCSPDNYLIADSIFFRSTTFCEFTEVTRFTRRFCSIVECGKCFTWHLRQLTKFIIMCYTVFCWLVAFSHFCKKCSHGQSINNDGLFSASFQCCCNRTVAKYPNSSRILSFEIHSLGITSAISVFNSLFLFCDCHVSISLSTAFFGGTGYCAI